MLVGHEVRCCRPQPLRLALMLYFLIVLALCERSLANGEEDDELYMDQGVATEPQLPMQSGYIRIDLPMKNASRPQGEMIKLNCELTGDPKPRYTWLKDEQPLPKDNRITIKSTNWGHRLIIRDLQTRDAGLYTCVGINVFGQMNTSMYLRITPPRPDGIGSNNPNRPDRNSNLDENDEPLGRALDFSNLQAEGLCQPFSESICSKHFAGQSVAFTQMQGLMDRERIIAGLFRAILNLNFTGRRCSTEMILTTLCLYAFPTCSSSQGVDRLVKPVCATDCQVLVGDVCRSEVEEIRENVGDEYDVSLLLDCSRLPNTTAQACNSVGAAVQLGVAATAGIATLVSTTNVTEKAIESSEMLVIVIPCILVGVLLVIVTSTLAMHFKKRNQRRQKQIQVLSSSCSFRTISHAATSSTGIAIYSLDQIRVLEEVGDGPHWAVRKGIVHGPPRSSTLRFVASNHMEVREVYLKILKDTTNVRMQQDFYREATLINELEHPHLLASIGVCKSPWMIVFEHVDAIDLKAFLLQNRNMVNELKLTSIIQQVAAGMSFLASRNFVHRDIAARNILIDANLHCKINDFGIANPRYSDDYLYTSRQTSSGATSTVVLPVRWMAPESISNLEFSTETDVWSFAVTIWEVFTFGDTPYAGFAANEVANIIGSGGTSHALQRPPVCPPGLYNLLLECWKMHPDLRPTFADLEKQLHTLGAAMNSLASSRGHPLALAIALQPTAPYQDDDLTQCLIHKGFGLPQSQLGCTIAMEAKSRTSLSSSDRSHQSAARKPSSDHSNLLSQTISTPRFGRRTGDDSLLGATRTLNTGGMATPRLASLALTASTRPLVTDQV